MKKFIFIFLISGFAGFAESPSNLDSLRRTVNMTRDTQKVNLYNLIAWEFRNKDLHFTDSFANLAIRLSTGLAYEKGIGQGYISLALVERNNGNYEKAVDNAQWALLHFIKAGYKSGYASAYNTIASINHLKGNHTIALYYYYQSLKISETLRDMHGIARSLNNIGVIYLDRGEHKKALFHYYKAFNILNKIHDESGIADELNNIGNVYQATNEPEQAVSNYLKSIQINKQNNDLKNASAGLNNIGTVYAEMGNQKEALNYYFQAMVINNALGDVESNILCDNNIANCYIKLDMYHTALKYVDEALLLALKHNLKEHIKDAYELLYRIEAHNENFKEALNYHELYKSYSDSFSMEINSEKVRYLEKEYYKAKEEKEKVIAGKDDEIHNRIHIEKEKRISQYIFIIGLILVIFVITIYVVFFILKWQKVSS